MIQKSKDLIKHLDFMLLDFLLAQIALPLAYYSGGSDTLQQRCLPGVYSSAGGSGAGELHFYGEL